MMMRLDRFAFVTTILAATVSTLAQDPVPEPAATSPPPVSVEVERDPEDLSAAAAVREGNRLLLDGKPDAALEAYAKARTLEPNAPQIDFVEGLAHYALGDFEGARRAFEDAAASSEDALLDDAIYSIGTTYHAQALQQMQDPTKAKEATAQLEEAMRHYQTVLADRPDHDAAKDANFKAASAWRKLKELMEQQQQEQQNQDDSESEKQDQDQKQDQENQDSANDEDQQDSEQKESSEQQSEEQQDEEASEDQQQSQSQDQEQSDEEQQAREEPAKQEQESREQAQRRLREMMQAMRDRKRKRPERVEPVRLVPVDKDW